MRVCGDSDGCAYPSVCGRGRRRRGVLLWHPGPCGTGRNGRGLPVPGPMVAPAAPQVSAVPVASVGFATIGGGGAGWLGNGGDGVGAASTAGKPERCR